MIVLDFNFYDDKVMENKNLKAMGDIFQANVYAYFNTRSEIK